MPFTMPNDVVGGTTKQHAQATPDSVDIDILVAGHNLTGVQSGCAVTAQGTPDMTLAVASGTVGVAGVAATVAAGNVTVTSAHASLPRFDLVVVSSAGVKSVTAGTPAAAPVFPAIPANSVVLAAVYVGAAVTAIATADIVDKRVIVNSTTYAPVAPAVAVADFGEGVLLSAPSPITISPTLTVASSGRYPMSMSRDGATVYSVQASTQLAYSTDDGVTWSLNSYVFPNTIQMVRELENGEVLVGCGGNTGASTGQLYTSTGWAANHATATFTLRQTASALGVYFHNGWSVSAWRNIVIANEYGAKTQNANARYSYISVDYGVTWRVLLDIGGGDGQVHMHGACYDPYWGRIWLSHGDSSNHVYYSDTMGSEGTDPANWSTVTYQDTGLKNQVVTIYALRDCVLFLSDSAPNGVHRYTRYDKTVQPVLEQAYRFDQLTTITYIGNRAYRAKKGNNPLLLSFIVDGSSVATHPGVCVATMDGFSFYTIFTDPTSYQGHGMLSMLGPTALGNYVGSLDDALQGTYKRFKIAAPTWAPRTAIPSAPGAGVATFLRSGQYAFTAGTIAPGTSATLGNQTFRCHPWLVPKGELLSAIGAEVTSAGDAGSTITDGVISGTTNLQSTLTTFSATWVGRTVSGTGIVAGTYISGFVDSHNVTLSQAATNGSALTVTVSGAVVRLGIYADDGAGYPAGLLLDAGTIDGNSPTVQDITISQILGPGVYWVGGVVQGVVTTQPTMRTAQTIPVPNVALLSTKPTAAATALGYTMTVTGALPSTFTATPALSGQMPRLHVKVA